MLEEYYSYEPRKGHGLKHNPLGSIVGPRVIGWIGTKNGLGVNNLAPYSFCNLFNYQPPIIAFASIGYKDSVRNITETGEFTWNLVSKELVEEVNLSSIEKNIDEFELTALTPLPGKLISAPRVGESLVSIECKVTHQMQLKNLNGDLLDTWMIFGEAVLIHIKKKLIRDNVYESSLVNTVLRGGGPSSYFEITKEQEFHLFRPK